MVRRVSPGPEHSPGSSPRSILKSPYQPNAPRDPSLTRPVRTGCRHPLMPSKRTPSPQTARIESSHEPHTLDSQPPLGLRQLPRTPSPGRFPMFDRQFPESLLHGSDSRSAVGRHGDLMRSPSPHTARIVRLDAPTRMANALAQSLSTSTSAINAASPIRSNQRALAHDCGIGVQLVRCPNGDIEVLAVREGSNAGEAGVFQGDRIVSVNGRLVSGLDCLQVARLIAGPENSRVHLRIMSTLGRTFETYVVRRPCAALSPESLAEATKRAYSFLSSHRDASTSPKTARKPVPGDGNQPSAMRSLEESPVLAGSMQASYGPSTSPAVEPPSLDRQNGSPAKNDDSAGRLREKEIALLEKDREIQRKDAELSDLQEKVEELGEVHDAMARELIDKNRHNQHLAEELEGENRRLKAQVEVREQEVSRTEADRFRALAHKRRLEESLKQSEGELESLRAGFLSLDKEYVALRGKGEEGRRELRQQQQRLKASQAGNLEMAERARELEADVLRQRALHEQAQKEAQARSEDLAFHARRARELAARVRVPAGEASRARPRLDFSGEWGEALIQGAGLSKEILARMQTKVEALQAENARLKCERDASNRSCADRSRQLDEVRRLIDGKDAELRAARAQVDSPLVAAAQQKLEADLASLREEKLAMQAALEKMPLVSGQRHEAEARRLRGALEASRHKTELLEQLLDLKGAAQEEPDMRARAAHVNARFASGATDGRDAGTGEPVTSRREEPGGRDLIGEEAAAGPLSGLGEGETSVTALEGTIQQLLEAQRRVKSLEQQLQHATSQAKMPEAADHTGTTQPSQGAGRHLQPEGHKLQQSPAGRAQHRLLSVSRNKIAPPRSQAARESGVAAAEERKTAAEVGGECCATSSALSGASWATHAGGCEQPNSASLLYDAILSIRQDYLLATSGEP